METREFLTLTTPVSQQTVVVKAWINAREKREISSIYLANAKFDSASKQVINSDPNVTQMVQDAELRTTIISIDGSADDIVNRCLDMKVQDFEFVVKEVEKIVNPELQKK